MEKADRNDVQDRADDMRITLGILIRKLREKMKWSQEKMAEEMGVATNTVSRMENGKYRMDTFLLASSVLGRDPTRTFQEESTDNKANGTFYYEELEGLETLDKNERDFILMQAKNSIAYFKSMKNEKGTGRH